MIDWLTIKAPLKINLSKFIWLVDKETGEMREFPQRIKLGGRDAANRVLVSFVDHGSSIRLSGNPLKFLTGQNLIGTINVQWLGYLFLRGVCKELNLKPTEREIATWKCGGYQLSRVDIAGYVRLPSSRHKMRVIRALRNHLAVLKVDLTAKGFGYVAVLRPRRKKLAAYDKTLETKDYRDVPQRLATDARLTGFIDKSLRIELQLLSTELSRLKLTDPRNWEDVSMRQILLTEIRRCGFAAGEARVQAAYSGKRLNRRQAIELMAWKSGMDILDGMPRTTRYRRIKDYAKFGQDVRHPYVNFSPKTVSLVDVFRKERLVVGSPNRLKQWPPLARLIEEREDDPRKHIKHGRIKRF